MEIIKTSDQMQICIDPSELTKTIKDNRGNRLRLVNEDKNI